MRSIKLKYKILGAIALFLFVLLFFLSTFVKNYIVKHSQELVGRKITFKELHFNYFRVSVRIKDFVMYETNKVDKFVSFDEFYVNFDPLALFRNEYSFSQITLVNPRVQLTQNKASFNFDDLTKSKDTINATPTVDTSKATSFRFTIKNLQLKKGQFVYEDLQIKNHIELNDLNLDIPLISWDSRQSNMGVSFRLGEKGIVDINAEVDNQNKKYTIMLNTTTLSISPMKDYLKDYLAISHFGGLLTSKIKIKGEFEQVMNIVVSGKVAIDSLLVNDDQNNVLMAVDKVETNLSGIDMGSSKFNISSVIVTNPKIYATLNRDMTNFERVLQPFFKSDSLASIAADTVKVDSSATAPLTYRVDTIKVVNGDIRFVDNTLNRPFNYDLSNINLTMTNLTESANKVPLAFSLIANKEGKLSGKILLNIVDPMNLSMDMTLKRLGLISFSPYSEYYIASPITQGWFNYDLSLQMTPTKLTNGNKIKIEEMEFGKKTKDSTAVRVPVKLALYILKDPNDNIAFDLPIEGNPSEPKFSYSKIVWKTLGNFLIKTAAAPFNALAGLVSSNPEDLEKLPFDYGQSTLETKQMETLSNIALIMQKKPNLIFRFIQFTNFQKERDFLALQRVKKEFILTSKGATVDSLQLVKLIKNLSNTDKDFTKYLRTRVPSSDSLGIEATCRGLYDVSELNALMNTLIANRNTLVKDYLLKTQNIKPEKVDISTADLVNIPAELQFPHFKIEVTIQ